MMKERIGKRAVLVIDDDEDTLFILQETLSSRGYISYVSPHAKDVMGILSRKHVDLILLDIHMGVIDGAEICRQIKCNPETASIPVVIFSANANIEHISLQCGADAFLRKPFQAAEFQKISDALLTSA